VAFREIWIVAFFAGAMLAWAQAPEPPAELDRALRARVDQFFRYHVEGGASLRKAMEMVAEDTKDEYFSSAKLQVLKYAITGIEYSDDFTKAKVTLDVTRNVAIFGRLMETATPMPTTWKIEGGEWMWYLDPSMIRSTPMSESQVQGGGTPGQRAELPPELTSVEAFNARVQAILRPAKVDKDIVTFRWGQASEEQVVFLNEFPGVELEIGAWPEIPGFSVTLDKKSLQARENGVIRFRYAPPPGFDARREPLPPPFPVALAVEPFNQTVQIGVRFIPAQ
jgi:hypothetical protein